MLMNKREIILTSKDLFIKDHTMYSITISDGKTTPWLTWCSILNAEKLITIDITHYCPKRIYNSTQPCQQFTPSVLCIWLTSSDSEESSSCQLLQSVQPTTTISNRQITSHTRWLLIETWSDWLENSGMKNTFNLWDT